MLVVWKMTQDERFLCAVDSGLDRVYIYEIDYETGKLEEANIIRGHLDSAPRRSVSVWIINMLMYYAN